MRKKPTKKAVTERMKSMSKLMEMEQAANRKTVLRGSMPENVLEGIRQQCLLLSKITDMLREWALTIYQGSILVEDEEDLIWVYQAPDERFKIFVDKTMLPTRLTTKPVAAPPDDRIDITFMEPIPGHIISLDQTAWKRHGAGAQKMA